MAVQAVLVDRCTQCLFSKYCIPTGLLYHDTIMLEGGQIYCQEEATSANTWVAAPSPTPLPLPLSACLFLRNLRLAQHTDIHTWIEAKATCQ